MAPPNIRHLLTLAILPPLFMSAAAQQDIDTPPAISPVLAIDFPDPALVEAGRIWYAFATSGNGVNIQVAASPSFIHHDWRLFNKKDALPDPGPWAINGNGNIWAPDVIQLDTGRWVMYYAAPPMSDASKHCIGAATSTNILGPYEPCHESFACPLNDGGAIDPAAFLDPKSNKLYVVYKIDGNSINLHGGDCNGGGDPKHFHPTPILLQQVDKHDGMTKLGSPVQILDHDPEDGPLVEAPSLFYNHVSDTYFLTFSSNCYANPSYDISFAYSKSLTQPFMKSGRRLMSTQTGGVQAPGGADMTENGTYALYHGTVAYQSNGQPIRHMYAAESEQIGFDMSALPIF